MYPTRWSPEDIAIYESLKAELDEYQRQVRQERDEARKRINHGWDVVTDEAYEGTGKWIDRRKRRQ